MRKLKCSLSIENLDVPILFGAQFLVNLAYADVCHSQIMKAEDRHGFDKWIPHLLGHEGLGFMTGAGPGASKINIGDRVMVSWLKSNGHSNDAT